MINKKNIICLGVIIMIGISSFLGIKGIRQYKNRHESVSSSTNIKVDISSKTKVSVKNGERNNEYKGANGQIYENFLEDKNRKVKMKIDVGDITIKKDSNQSGKLECKCEIKGSSQEIISDLLENIHIKFSSNKEHLFVCVVYGDTGIDAWTYIEKEYKGYKLSVDINYFLPEHVKDITAICDVGTIKLDNVTVTANVEVDTGEIIVNNVEFINKCKLIVDTGDVKYNMLDNISKKSKVAIEVDTGDIIVDVGNNTLTSKYIINGCCNIDPQIELGDINIK